MRCCCHPDDSLNAAPLNESQLVFDLFFKALSDYRWQEFLPGKGRFALGARFAALAELPEGLGC